MVPRGGGGGGILLHALLIYTDSIPLVHYCICFNILEERGFLV